MALTPRSHGRGVGGRSVQILGVVGLILSLVVAASNPAVAGPPPGVIATAAGGGPADGSQATLASIPPCGVADAGGGAVFVSDCIHSAVYRVSGTGVITRVAGNGSGGFAGDGGPATSAQLSYPSGLAVDSAGNLYVADVGNSRVRRVSTSGTITTVAGTGTYGSSGDGGAATGAQLRAPVGVDVDSAGNLYIADTDSNRVRRVSSTGTITTVAGNGTLGFSGDGGAATSAQLRSPTGVAVDAAGNLYVADSGNNRVRMVSSGTITTVAGTGIAGFTGDGGPAIAAQLTSPTDLAVDASGSLYIADAGNNRVRRVSSSGTITTVAGNGTEGFSGDGGPAAAAQLLAPSGVAVDAAGNLYVADTGNNRVRQVSASGSITTVAGNGAFGFSGDGGPAAAAELSHPQGVAVDAAGNVYVVDTGNNRVRQVSSSGTITTVAGNGLAGATGDGGPATAAELDSPYGATVDPAGNLYIADAGNSLVRRVSTSGTITTVAGDGTYGFSGDGGPATAAQLSYPTDVAVDPAGNLYIADADDSRVRRVSTSGTITTVAGDGTYGFSGDGGPASAARLNGPTGVAVDAAGNLYIADADNARVRRVSSSGIISTVAGNGAFGFSGDGGPATAARLGGPQSVAVDSSGNLYIADTDSDRVRVVGGSGAPLFTAASPPGSATVGVAFGPYTFAATGTPAPTFSVASGGLPPGLTLTGSGVLSGTPTTAGSFTFSVRAANGVSPDAMSPLVTITVGQPPGLYSPVTPTRLLDTRFGTGGPATPFGAGESRDLLVTAGGVVPATATAVVLNVTATSPSTGGFATVFPAGVARPLASNLNFEPGSTIPNLVTVGVGTGSKVSLYNDRGTTHLIADVVGYYQPGVGAGYTAITPTRLLDSRDGTGGFSTKWGPGETRPLTVAGPGAGGGVVPADASAVVLNVTVTQPTVGGFLTVFPADVGLPLASNLNFNVGQTIPNLVIVGVGRGGSAEGKVSIYNNAGSTHVLADVVGYYKVGTGGQFTPVTPSRLLDTRSGAALGVQETRALSVRGGATGVPVGATAVVVNVTATQPSTGGFLTVFPAGVAKPLASNLNFDPGQTIPNLVMVGVGTVGASAGSISLYNNAGTVHVIVDIVGYIT